MRTVRQSNAIGNHMVIDHEVAVFIRRPPWRCGSRLITDCEAEAVRRAAGLLDGRHDRTQAGELSHARRPLTVDLRLL